MMVMMLILSSEFCMFVCITGAAVTTHSVSLSLFFFFSLSLYLSLAIYTCTYPFVGFLIFCIVSFSVLHRGLTAVHDKTITKKLNLAIMYM